jgi:RNA polymerase sigma-70 factor (ECF subfamily)
VLRRGILESVFALESASLRFSPAGPRLTPQARGRHEVWEAYSMNDDQFTALLARARAGEVAAVEALLGEFEQELQLIVRVHMPRVLRGKFDSMDFVQAVWASVFTGSPEGWGHFANIRHFRAFLAGVARNKVLAEFRRRTKTSKYNLSLEEPLYVQRGGREEPRSVVAPGPSPSQQAQAADRLEQIVQGRSPVESQMVALRRQGLTYEEIAQRLGVHERSVRRIFEELRARHDQEPRA